MRGRYVKFFFISLSLIVTIIAFNNCSGGFKLLSALTLSQSSEASHLGEGLKEDQQILSLTDQLIQGLSDYQAANAKNRPAIEEELNKFAIEREALMLKLLALNPQIVSIRVIPAAVRNRMPVEAKKHIEKEVHLNGRLVTMVSDNFESRQSKREVFLHVNDNSKTRQKVHVGFARAQIAQYLGLSGKLVKITAYDLAGNLVLSDEGSLQAAGGLPTNSIYAPTLNPVTGDHKTLVVMVNFTDKNIACTKDDLASRLFGTSGNTMNVAYQESSGGIVSFSGDVAGPYPINYTSTGTCDYNGMYDAGLAQAKAAGYNTSLYQHVSVVTPGATSCYFNGAATMPGSWSFINKCDSTGVFTHELGHNVSFPHASTPTSEYADYTDPMGTGQLVQFNAVNRAHAGWLGDAQLKNVTTSGTYNIEQLENSTSLNPLVLTIRKNDTDEIYYLSLREGVGIDSNLMTGYKGTVTIHRSKANLLSNSYNLGLLTVGQTFTDSVNGISITYQATTGSSATLGISIGTISCFRVAPTVTFTPSSQSVDAGSTANYTIGITNNNASVCGSSTFNLATSLPSGVSATMPSNVSLAAGASTQVTLAATVNASTSAGTFNLDVSATDSSSGGTSTTGHGTLTILPPVCVRNAPTLTMTPTSQSVNAGAYVTYGMRITNNDTWACPSQVYTFSQNLPAGAVGALPQPISLFSGGSDGVSWTVTAGSSMSAGTYNLSLSSTDSLGVVRATPATLVVNSVVAPPVTDTTAPTFTSVSPVNGSTLPRRGNVSISASASDASGISSLQIIVDGSIKQTCLAVTSCAYSWSMSKVSTGSHTILIKAIDNSTAKNINSVSLNVQK